MTQFLTFVLVLGMSILFVATVGWGAEPAFDSDSKGRTVSASAHNRAELSFMRQF